MRRLLAEQHQRVLVGQQRRTAPDETQICQRHDQRPERFVQHTVGPVGVRSVYHVVARYLRDLVHAIGRHQIECNTVLRMAVAVCIQILHDRTDHAFYHETGTYTG